MRTEEPGRATARRPPDRKARIAAAAGDLFCERGYHNVSVADVAASVGITAPALYRHFKGKPDLLLHVVTGVIEKIAATAQAAPDLDSYLCASAARSVDRRGAAILWQREARHLPEASREELRRALSDIAGRIGALLKDARPELSSSDLELTAWCVVSVFGSISGHRAALPRRRFEQLLYELGDVAAHHPLGTAVISVDDEPGPTQLYADLAVSRREELLNAAIRLFDERGFQSVSTDDIGEATGATGPSIYKHFPSKTDLLVAAVLRGGEQRRSATERALARAGTPRESLNELLRSYIEFAQRHSHLIGLLIGELDQLPEKERKSSRQAQRDYLALWVHVLDEVRPGLDTAEAKITVSAVMTVVDNAVRTGRLGERPDLADRLFEICTALLLRTGSNS
ncbi:TetR/AcrR family transcriptional regulator [Streptomyces sp. NPDC005953]|uniref:TetR/AcrR family transcriptional regulator n=1 Tax=Streptomyces sp. NPDC005953 TaxID=3156719 RepID=UPI003406E146